MLRGETVCLSVRRSHCPALCVVLFAEKLMHTTVPWRGIASERRTVFYKFVPFGMHHADKVGSWLQTYLVG
jgi:hypothetical protein